MFTRPGWFFKTLCMAHMCIWSQKSTSEKKLTSMNTEAASNDLQVLTVPLEESSDDKHYWIFNPLLHLQWRWSFSSHETLKRCSSTTTFALLVMKPEIVYCCQNRTCFSSLFKKQSHASMSNSTWYCNSHCVYFSWDASVLKMMMTWYTTHV